MPLEPDAAERAGIRNDELELEKVLPGYMESTPRGGGSIGVNRIERAVKQARAHLEEQAHAAESMRLPWPRVRQLLVFSCQKFPGPVNDLRWWILTSIGPDRVTCLQNLVRGMRAIRAIPDELLVGNRAHLPIEGGYGIACAFAPGTRRPLGQADHPAVGGGS